MQLRLGVVGIVVDDPLKAYEVNSILSKHGQLIIGRMGIPRVQHNDSGVSVISLIVQGTNEDIGALTGQLGTVRGVQVKSALSTK